MTRRKRIMFHICPIVPFLSFLCMWLATQTSPAADQIAEEQTSLQTWMEWAFVTPQAQIQAATAKKSHKIQILHASHKVLKNKTVWNTPLALGNKTYTHGIYMDAPAAVRIRLTKPAKQFTATIGIDKNDNTKGHPDIGSASFHVSTGGRRIYTSSVRKMTDNPLPIKVPLDGATEFTIEVDDAGNGRAHDQADWADAAVTFEDGQTLFIDTFADFEYRASGNGSPFFFLYGGRPSSELLPGWQRSEETKTSDGKTIKTVSYQCPKTGLIVETQITTFADSAAVDWLCFLENTGKTDTPIIDGFVPVNLALLKSKANEPVTLRWSKGDDYSPSSFMPHDDPLQLGNTRHFAPDGGRSSNGHGGGVSPYFNILGPRGGWIVAVGWSGQWKADFTREKDGHVLLSAGMEDSHFRLRPGERVRTPRIVLLPYNGKEMIDGHNRFRRLVFDHYCQQKDNRPILPPICHNTAATVYRSKKRATEANQLAIIRKMAELGCEAYWMDAYWYPQPWHRNVGNWFPRPEDFPRGMKPLADAAHKAGMKFVLWFEPERVIEGTRFDREHGEFLIKPPGGMHLFNLGNPNARKFLTDFLDSRIKRWGIDVYRNDFNIAPLGYWRHNDKPERRGTSEMHYIEGLYRMWSDLLKRNPGLCIDNCASGGRRIDVEISQYAWALWRSDYNDIGQGLKGEKHWPRMAVADQVHTAGLALYMPLNTGPVWDMHPYSIRSAMSGSLVLYERILHEGFPDKLAKQGIAEAKTIRRFFLGDYYPLVKLTDKQNDWWAYQLHGNGEKTNGKETDEEGIAMAFRRPDCTRSSATLELRRINTQKMYEVSITGETYKTAPFKKMSGNELKKIKIEIPEQPGSCLIRYRQASGEK